MGGGNLLLNKIRVCDDRDPSPKHIFAVDSMQITSF
jgi:hypothetical protein